MYLWKTESLNLLGLTKGLQLHLICCWEWWMCEAVNNCRAEQTEMCVLLGLCWGYWPAVWSDCEVNIRTEAVQVYGVQLLRNKHNYNRLFCLLKPLVYEQTAHSCFKTLSLTSHHCESTLLLFEDVMLHSANVWQPSFKPSHFVCAMLHVVEVVCFGWGGGTFTQIQSSA